MNKFKKLLIFNILICTFHTKMIKTYYISLVRMHSNKCNFIQFLYLKLILKKYIYFSETKVTDKLTTVHTTKIFFLCLIELFENNGPITTVLNRIYLRRRGTTLTDKQGLFIHIVILMNKTDYCCTYKINKRFFVHNFFFFFNDNCCT